MLAAALAFLYSGLVRPPIRAALILASFATVPTPAAPATPSAAYVPVFEEEGAPTFTFVWRGGVGMLPIGEKVDADEVLLSRTSTCGTAC